MQQTHLLHVLAGINYEKLFWSLFPFGAWHRGDYRILFQQALVNCRLAKCPKISQISKPGTEANVHAIYKGHRISRLNVTERITAAMGSTYLSRTDLSDCSVLGESPSASLSCRHMATASLISTAGGRSLLRNFSWVRTASQRW